MDILGIAYMVASTSQIVAGVPQITKVIRAKSSKELSLTSWGSWSITQFVCLAYTISTGEFVLMSMSALWTLYYMIMMTFIAYYRWPQYFKSPFARLRVRPQVAQVDTTDSAS